MKGHSFRQNNLASAIAASISIGLVLQAGAIATVAAQTKTKQIKIISKAKPKPKVAPSPKAKAFFQLVSGKWAKITDDARLSMTIEQLNIAALQCHATKNLDIAKATKITSISKRVSQQLSRVLVYKKLKKGLQRIDFKTRQSLLFPKLKIGKISNGRDGFELTNTKAKVTISFGKIKQGNKTIPVMIEGKALYLKCPK